MGEIVLYTYNVAEFVLKPTEPEQNRRRHQGICLRAETITNKLHASVFYSKLSSIRGTELQFLTFLFISIQSERRVS